MFEVALARIINRRQITRYHPQRAIYLIPAVFQELAPKTISRDKWHVLAACEDRILRLCVHSRWPKSVNMSRWDERETVKCKVVHRPKQKRLLKLFATVSYEALKYRRFQRAGHTINEETNP